MPIPSLRPDATPDDSVRIGLWGSTRSGKTTYLSAVPLAAQEDGAGRSWRISGIGEEATRFLKGNVRLLSAERRFPPSTMHIEPLRWAVFGEEHASRRLRSLRRKSEIIQFELQLQDVPGEVFKAQDRQTAGAQQAIDHLAKADGLVYLFDPLADLSDGTTDEGENFLFFYDTLQLLFSRVRDRGRLDNGRLPHYLAVCLTKFDDTAFFKPVVEASWVSQDEPGSIPYVPVDQTRGLFDWVCDDLLGGTAPVVRKGIYNYFHPSRIRFFATSAIGFRLNRNNKFDYRDYDNVDRIGGQARIRTVPKPVNVMEPLVWLERSIRLHRPKAGKQT